MSRKRDSGGAQAQGLPPPQPMDVDDGEISEDEEGGRRVAGIYIPPPSKPHCSTESKGPRLIITNIVNVNFKSYAGKVVLGPFHHRFSAIIGPNGSGKSNVIDSMLFVFGYRAQKIRSKKLSVLLHSSSSHPDITSCSVKVVFERILDKPDGGYEVLPNSRIVVSRTAFKDNSSFYQIDERRVQFKEVAKLLRDHGIDLDHNRFLILQGEVESISMMKPKALTENECGLLEYLEDIIGTTRYKKPLFQINEAVEQLNVERTEKHNRCKLAEREMNDLEKPMQEAVEYLKLENTNTRAQNLLYQKYMAQAREEIGQCAEKKEAVDKELQESDEQFAEVKREREEKEAIVREEQKQREALTRQKEETEGALKAAAKKYEEVQASMVEVNNRRKRLKTQLEKEKANLEKLKEMPAKNEREIAECEEKIDKLSKQRAENEEIMTKNLASLPKEIQGLSEQRAKFEDQLIELRKSADEDKAQLTLTESELEIVKQNETTEKRKLATLKGSYADSKTSLEEKSARFGVAKKELADARQAIQQKSGQLEECRREEATLSQRVAEMRSKIDEHKNEMASAHSTGRVLDFLMKQRSNGVLPGILGRLGDLGGIPAKYDVAISTSCGRLDNIVVDTVDTAQRAIELLKNHDVGRATFIALEKVNHLASRCRDRIQTPENVHRLFDLITVEDERVRPAFYFSLYDTLVSDNLEQGTRIAYSGHRWRVVTLRGELIETSGTMSGGGRTQMRGRMGERVQTKTKHQTPKSNKEMERLMVEAEEAQSRVNFLQQQEGTLERELRELAGVVKARESEVRRLEVEIRTLTNQLPQVEAQIERQQAKVDSTHSDADAVARLEAQLKQKQKAWEKSSEAVRKVKTEVDAIEAQIEDIRNKKVKQFKQKVDELTKQVNKLTANCSKLRAEVNASERNVKKSQDKIDNMTAEISTAEERIRKDDEVRKKCDADKDELSERLKELTAELAKAEEGSSAIRKEIAALQKRENEAKVKRLEVEQRKQAVEARLAELHKKIPHWQSLLDPLRLRDIPNEPPPEPLKTYTDGELAGYTVQDIQYQLTSHEEALRHKPNMGVIDEFMRKREVYMERIKSLEDITTRRNEMRNVYDEVRKLRFNEFTTGFNIITKKLKEMYQMITLGGDAELELVDSMDPFNEGIVFSVRPPKKSWKQISNLSGGEKTLSSLALVFALHYYKPSPLYVMDEIDAALDFKNVSIVAHYIKERTKNAQFIIISLRSNMFELSDYLVGIYKTHDCTASITVKNRPPKQKKNETLSQTQQSHLTQDKSEIVLQGEESKAEDSLTEQIVAEESKVEEESMEKTAGEEQMDTSVVE